MQEMSSVNRSSLCAPEICVISVVFGHSPNKEKPFMAPHLHVDALQHFTDWETTGCHTCAALLCLCYFQGQKGVRFVLHLVLPTGSCFVTDHLILISWEDTIIVIFSMIIEADADGLSVSK